MIAKKTAIKRKRQPIPKPNADISRKPNIGLPGFLANQRIIEPANGPTQGAATKPIAAPMKNKVMGDLPSILLSLIFIELGKSISNKPNIEQASRIINKLNGITTIGSANQDQDLYLCKTL